MLDVVAKLLTVEADLVVTVTAPLDRHRPNNERDRIKARNLMAQAKARVQQHESNSGGAAVASVLRSLDDAAARVDLGAGALGYVVVATADGFETHMLPFPVVEAVTVGTAPATRSLIQGLQRSPRYRLVVVSDKATRLFEGMRDDLWEQKSHGFPFSADVVPRDLRSIAGRFARQPAGDDKEQWRNFYRDVDDGLTTAIGDDPLPIVLAGVAVSTAMFEDVSANKKSVIGKIDGAQEGATVHTLGSQAWPLIRQNLEARRSTVIAELSDAKHANKAVTGIDDVWRLVSEGRGRLLVVEEDYRAEPMVEIDHQLVTSAADRPGVMEDPVDELIEHHVRSGGAVEFVAHDSLAHLGQIGLILP